MLAFIMRRALLAVPSLFGLLVITFFLIHVVPADPAAALAGDNATPAQIAEIRHKFGLDQPLPEQFWRYLVDVAHLDFGDSQYSNRPVASDIAERLPATLELTTAALLLATLIGIPLGVIAALCHNRWPDFILRSVSIAGIAVATFWFAIMLQMLFAMQLAWLPLRGALSVGMEGPGGPTGFLLFDCLVTGHFDVLWNALQHLILPAATLSLGGIATITRFTRAGVLETMQKEFVTYERAVGYPRRRMIWIYVLRNSVTASVTQIGLLFGSLIAGAIVVESIFDWPGIGSYTVQAILTADTKVMLAITLVVGLIYTVVNILTDLLLGLIDPRIWSRG